MSLAELNSSPAVNMPSGEPVKVVGKRGRVGVSQRGKPKDTHSADRRTARGELLVLCHEPPQCGRVSGRAGRHCRTERVGRGNNGRSVERWIVVICGGRTGSCVPGWYGPARKSKFISDLGKVK